jgi:hypothetical protein
MQQSGMSMIDVTQITQQIERVESELKSPYPTPPIGTLVVWYDKGDISSDNQRAAIVTQVEGPGKISVTVFPPRAMPAHKKGVTHVTDPMHEKRHNSVTVMSGAWDYPDHVAAPKSHLSFHIASLEKKKEILETQLQQVEAVIKKNSANQPSRVEGKSERVKT